jgi:hypothetical protein
VRDAQDPGGRGAGRALRRVVLERDRQIELARPLGQQVPVAEADQLVRQRLRGERQAQLRADAGRLTRGQREARDLRT